MTARCATGCWEPSSPSYSGRLVRWVACNDASRRHQLSGGRQLPPSIVSRRLKGEQPTVDLVIGYHWANASPILRMFLSRIDALSAQARQTTIKRAPGSGPIKITSGPPASYSPPGELNDATIEAKVVAGSQGDREPATRPQRRAGGGGMPRAFAGAGGAAEGCSGPAQRVAHRYRRRTRDFQAPGAATIDWDRGRALIARARRNHSFDRASHGLSVRSVSCAA